MSDRSEQSCPSLVDLESFLERPNDRSAIGRHLELCALCRGSIEEIRANSRLLARIRSSSLSRDGGAVMSLRDAPVGSPASISGYEILDEIHRGGQGIVYRARQIATSRVVAVKFLLAGAFATSRQRRRFEREIELIAELDHPAIVTVHDSGRTESGLLYLVMQYVEGAPLKEWAKSIRSAKLATPQSIRRTILQLFLRICDGVIAAHQHGVIHRDLKSANIIVSDDGERTDRSSAEHLPQPKILDFGLARPLVTRAGDEDATRTIEGAFLGTLAYCSPEQTRGDLSAVDVRSDVYSLGVILYELLAGSTPVSTEGDLREVLDAIQMQEPRPPGAVTRRAGFAADDGLPLAAIDSDLDAIVLKALAKEQVDRYQSVAAFRDDLTRYLRGDPIEARRASRWYVLRKTMWRHRVPAAIAAAFVIVLVTASSALFVAWRRAKIETDKVRQINIFLEDTLGSVTPARAGDDVTVRQLLDEAVQWIDLALADQPEVASSIRVTVANSYRNLRLFDEAEHQVDQALRTRRRLFGDDHPQVAQCLNLLGLLRRDQGRLDEARQHLLDALQTRRRTLSMDHYDVSMTLANLASVKRLQGRFDEAEAALQESLRIRRDLFGEGHPDIAMCHFRLAQIAEDRGDVAQAEARHREALRIRRNTLHKHHPDLARSLSALIDLYRKWNRPDDAANLQRELDALNAGE